jgi:hypothetical protein
LLPNPPQITAGEIVAHNRAREVEQAADRLEAAAKREEGE